MKRPEFIYRFTQMRKRSYQKQVDAGTTMRVSEAVMGMADAEKDAKFYWRNISPSLQSRKPEDIWPGKTDEERGGPYLPDPRKGSKLMKLLKSEKLHE